MGKTFPQILVYHAQSHIGGGDTYIRAIIAHLKKQSATISLYENQITASLVYRILRREFDVVLLNAFYPRDIMFALLCKARSVSIINITHGLWFLETKSMYPKQSFHTTLKYWLAQYVLCVIARRVIVTSEYAFQLVKKYFPVIYRKTEVIYGGADRTIFSVKKIGSINKAKRALQIPLETIVLCLACRLERRKGIHIAIDAVKQVLKKRPNTLLFLLFPSGAFNQFEYFAEIGLLINKRGVGNNVRFVTGVHTQTLATYFRASDLFIQSSTELETFGLSLIEAMQTGCPAISFNSGYSPIIVRRIRPQLVVNDINPVSLANRILWYLALTKKEQRAIRMQAVRVANSFSWHKSALKFMYLIQQLHHG